MTPDHAKAKQDALWIMADANIGGDILPQFVNLARAYLNATSKLEQIEKVFESEDGDMMQILSIVESWRQR